MNTPISAPVCHGEVLGGLLQTATMDFVQAMIVSNHTSLDVGWGFCPQGPSKLDIPFALPSQTVAIGRAATLRIVQEIPQLLDARSAPLMQTRRSAAPPKDLYSDLWARCPKRWRNHVCKRLESAGVEVTLDHFEDGFRIHDFTSWPTNISGNSD